MTSPKRIRLDSSGAESATNTEQDSYFRCYDEIGIHTEMLKDTLRTKTYKWAILKNFHMFYDKIILDVGCGTGILSMFCVQAGARRVYAVDASSIALEAIKVIERNKMQSRIQVIHGKLEEIELPEKVDVIVSEWMGYMMLYENMLSTVLYARDQWLKPNGLMFPTTGKLYISLGCDEDQEEDNEDLWEDLGNEYGLNLSPLKSLSNQCLVSKVCVRQVYTDEIISQPQEISSPDFRVLPRDNCQVVESDFSLCCFGSATLNCFVLWFDVGFLDDVTLSTSPYKPVTHWQQCVLYLEEAVELNQDSVISGSIKIQPTAENSRFLQVTLSYSYNDGEDYNECTQKFRMDDIVT